MPRKRTWKPKSPMQRKWAAQDRAAWHRWHTFKCCTDPWWKTQNEAADHDPFWTPMPRLDVLAKRTRDLVLYAAAIGHKRGDLPIDLANVRATIKERTTAGSATVLFERSRPKTAFWDAVATITVGNLDAWPSAPIEKPDRRLPAAA